MARTVSLDAWLADSPTASMADTQSQPAPATITATRLPKALAVFTSEPLFSAQACDLYRTRMRREKQSQRHVLEADRSFDPHEFISLFSEVSLFGDAALIDLRLSQPKASKELAQALKQVCDWLADGRTENHLLVSGPALNKTQSKAAGFAELFQVAIEITCPSITADTLPQWLGKNASRLGLKLGGPACQWLAERTEGNLLAAHQALEKLAAEHQGEVQLDTVQAVASDSARFNVFDLGPTLLCGDAKRIARMLEGLEAEGEASTLVLWCLNEEIKTLRGIRQDMQNGTSLQQACRNHRVWGARQQYIGQAIRRNNSARLAQLVQRCYLAEKTIKGLHQGNPWNQLLQIALELAGIPGPHELTTSH
ncbi:MAG: DNA polymerase III subunit delta [Limnobacter sp.]|nr:DNA polymerase III subunit delta [Limnobacter sp.]